jgi:pimeloyl-ACP methyl ester carboxylesterase
MGQLESNPVVLIHGWGGSFRETWQKSGVDALLTDIGRNVVGLDLLGHGSQEKPHDPEAYDILPSWLLEHLPHDSNAVDVVAFSLGALTTLSAMISAPERFGRVILAGIGDGVFEESKPDRNRKIIDALEGRVDENDSLSRMFAHYGSQGSNDKEALIAIMKRRPGAPLDPSSLAGIASEVLVVIGDKDFAAPADRLAEAFPNGRLVTLKNTDHFATTDSFAFIDAILDFMA